MHEELVKSLRQCAVASCAGCKNDLVEVGCRRKLQREAADVIEELTAADVRPVKRGKWRTSKYDAFNVRCSECGHVSGNFWNFCPNCGADMREALKEEK